MPELTGTLTQILTYPIKSCAAVQHESIVVKDHGLEHDRQWLIVDGDGQFQTQRQIPHLVWIEPLVHGHTLSLRAPDMEIIELPFATATSPKRAVTVWGEALCGHDMGDEAAAWLDDYLQVPGRSFRLVQFDPEHKRLSDTFWCGEQPAAVQFADGFAINILSEASLRHFNERLIESGLDPVDVRRFRPNLVLDGLDAYDEDLVHTIEFHSHGTPLVLELVKPCPRCQVPNIDPLTAAVEPEIGAALARYRQQPAMDHAVCFAMNAVVRSKADVTLQANDAFIGHWRFDGS